MQKNMFVPPLIAFAFALLTLLQLVTHGAGVSSTVEVAPPLPQRTKLTPEDVSLFNFGWTVSLSKGGTHALIGSYLDDDGGAYSGSAYVFVREGDSGWQQQSKLTAPDRDAYDEFGYSVALSANAHVAVVGAHKDEQVGKNSGSAYIFTRSGNAWDGSQKLLPELGVKEAHFGYCVAVSYDGEVVAVGAPRAWSDDHGESGQVYVYVRMGASAHWDLSAKLLAADVADGDGFGTSVAVSGIGKAVLASSSSDNKGKGAAYLFEPHSAGAGSNKWKETNKLTGRDTDEYDYFGTSVSLDEEGTTAVVGALGAGDDEEGGAIHVFTRKSSTSSSWKRQARLRVEEDRLFDGTCASVSASGDIIVAGRSTQTADGSMYVFAHVDSFAGSEDVIDGGWVIRGRLNSTDGTDGDFFGWSATVSPDGEYALVGSPQDWDSSYEQSGSGYLFWCPTGHTCDHLGGPNGSALDPQPCVAGKYCAPWATDGTPCPPGSFCPEKSSVPTKCTKGTYSKQLATSCQKCDTQRDPADIELEEAYKTQCVGEKSGTNMHLLYGLSIAVAILASISVALVLRARNRRSSERALGINSSVVDSEVQRLTSVEGEENDLSDGGYV